MFVALCASVLVNFALAAAAFSKFQGTSVDEESRPRFREMIVERGTRGSDNKIAVITLRGLISTSVNGNVGDSMVDDLRWQLEQARNDDDVRAVVLEVDSPGGEVTASGQGRTKQRGEPNRTTSDNVDYVYSLPSFSRCL